MGPRDRMATARLLHEPPEGHAQHQEAAVPPGKAGGKERVEGMTTDNAKQYVDSTADQRTVNNTMRHQYRVLSDEEKKRMQQVKDCGAEFIALLHIIGGTDGSGEKFASRDLSLAATHMEDAVMRAVRHITK